jgi:glucosamine--fructose-6-phosphate aminotransferase (isomerizing)
VCGIIGVTGRSSAVSDILDGLRRLEYRGYDSSGVVAVTSDQLGVVKRSGKLDRLAEALATDTLVGSTGIGHTRWATHGAPTDANAHPHLDPTGRVAVVHNGIIENYRLLRAELDGAPFASETDTEVVAHLIARELAAPDAPDLLEAVRRVVGRLEGAYALCVLSSDEPDTIVVARQQAPLIVAAIDGVGLCASDVAALIEHTDTCAALLDGQLARIRPGGYEVIGLDGAPASPDTFTVSWDLSAAEKQGYDHFMLKEIHEQPIAVAETLLGRDDGTGRIVLDELRIDPAELSRIDKVFLLAAGTSLHAGMAGRTAIEHWAGIPVEVEVASEFRYRDPIVTDRTLVVAISQSGETIDTIAAAEHARAQGAPVLAITNVVGSTLARAADGVIYTRAGPEIAVASTKAFTTQIVACLVLALYLAQRKDRAFASEIRDVLERLDELPGLIHRVLADDSAVLAAAERFKDVGYTMFIGRHASLPIAYEGALKLKEVSYLHAEAFPAGEMKHGPIALIEPGSLVVAVAHDGHVFSKMVSNIQEVRARGASVLAIGTESSRELLMAHADVVISVPDAPHELLAPVLTVLPLQLYAYHVAVLRGADVDQPRNLAKTVTVE